MNSCQNEINIEMRYYPIVEIKMVLRQPVYNKLEVYYMCNYIILSARIQ